MDETAELRRKRGRVYTVSDLLAGDVPKRGFRIGWKVEATRCGNIAVSYTVLNFDWKGVGADDSSEALFSCPHFLKMMERLKKAKAKLGSSASYYEASSVSELKFVLEAAGVRVDLDRMLAAEIGRKSAELVAKNGGKRRRRTRKGVVK